MQVATRTASGAYVTPQSSRTASQLEIPEPEPSTTDATEGRARRKRCYVAPYHAWTPSPRAIKPPSTAQRLAGPQGRLVTTLSPSSSLQPPGKSRSARAAAAKPARWTAPATHTQRSHFLRRGEGCLCTTPRAFAKLSRNSKYDSEAMSHRPSTGPDGWPIPDKTKWLSGRWVNPTDAVPDPAPPRALGGAERAAREGVGLEAYKSFYKATTGEEATTRVLQAYQDSLGLAPQASDLIQAVGSPQAGIPSSKPQAVSGSRLSVGEERSGPWWQYTDRYFEPKPRPPRDPSGIEPRNGVGMASFNHSLRQYDLQARPIYSPSSSFEKIHQIKGLHRPEFILHHVGPSAGGEARSIADFGQWIDANGQPLQRDSHEMRKTQNVAQKPFRL